MKTKISLMKLLIYVLIVCNGLLFANGLKCDRTPEASSANKSPPDGRFKLRILGDPDRYIPGENYTISLEGISRPYGLSHKFAGFFVTVEKEYSELRLPQRFSDDEGVGTFHIISNAISKISEKCRNLVTHTSSFPKSEVPLTWTAPATGSGCVVFKSTVIEHRDVWYMDDGALSKTLCEDESDSGDQQPLVLEQCTACDEAKYELTFEGLWSRHTHPKDFPSNGWLTKFSDVIGASHTTDYRFWTYGEHASDGLKEVAEHASTRQLERELKDQSEHIRTIIKARGISFPNVTGKTFAVFRVDSKHHLVSLVSMIFPSPDWFVGVSGLELCLANGSWIEEKILNLYPYDAGTDSGPTYISPDQPTIPKEAIRRIKPNYPNDPRSPFYDQENKEMKPIARLYLSRQRLYEKNCDAVQANQDQQDFCATGKWSDWSECSNPCGPGEKSRQRYYLNLQLAHQKGCRKNLTQHSSCTGRSDNCEDETIEEEPNTQVITNDRECKLTEWTDDGECDKPCGKGKKLQTRKFKSQKNHHICQKRYPDILLTQEMPCEGEKCTGDIAEEKPVHRKMNSKCRLSDYSRWSPCSASCGIGERFRVRVPLDKHMTADEHLQKIFRLYKKLNSKKNKHRNEIDDEDEEERDETGDGSEEYEDLSELEILGVSDPEHPCHNQEFVQKQKCGMRNKPCDADIEGIPPFCLLEPKVGACRGQVENRWYFDKNLLDCAIFPYTGCHGNKNNFESQEICLQTCTKNTNINRHTSGNSLTIMSLVNSKYPETNEKIDCEVTAWKRTPCNVTCGEGFRWKFRDIVKHPQNGGLPCPRKLMRPERCHVDCDNPKAAVASTTSTNKHHHHQCRYSEWSAWSPCSKSCGDSAVQIRTRTVISHQSPHLCTERLEERRCDVMPCLLGSEYNYNYRS